MVLLLLLCVAAGSLLAQPAIISGPVVDSITYSTARITWLTDVASTTVIYYGREGLDAKTTAPGRAAVHSWYLSGLAPSTVYRFRVCSAVKQGDPETCAEVRSVMTAPGPATPSLPEAPRKYMDLSPPAGNFGEPFIVEPDCSNLPAILSQIAKLDDDRDYEIHLNPGTTCAGQFVFPARPKHKGWIHVKSTGSLPPEGVRIGDESARQLATFITNAIPGARLSIANVPAACSPGALMWTINAPGMGLLVCENQGKSDPQTITEATYGGSEPVVIVVPGHGYRTGNIVRVTGTGVGVDNQNWRITVLDENRFVLEGSRGRGNFSGGGTVKRNDNWTQVRHQAGTELPDSCNVNEWFFRTDISPATEAAYWCTSPNNWVRMRAIVTSSAQLMAAIQFAPNAARYRFTGLEITHVATPNPHPPGWDQPDYRQGVYGSLVAVGISNDRVIFDRCDVHGHDYPSRLSRGFYLGGSNIAIINSRIHKVNRWLQRSGGVNLEADAIDVQHGPGPGHIENNYLEAVGITVFFPDPGRNFEPAADYVIRRNHFAKPERYLFGSPANVSGKNYMNRHPFELKMGKRIILEGNIFDGNWADVNQGAMLMLTPRHTALTPPVKISKIEDGIITLASSSYPLVPGMLVQIKGSGTPHHDGIQVVDQVLSASVFTIKDPPSGTGTSGQVIAVSSNMQISDVDIRNNIFRFAPNLLWINGHHDSISTHLTTKTTQRIRLYNNLVYGMDARSAAEGGRASPIGANRGGRSGIFIAVAYGMEDLIVQKNTVYDFKGQSPTFIFFDSTKAGANAGLDIRDNIFVAQNAAVSSLSGGNFGKESLDLQWMRHPDPSWIFKGNVFCCNLRGNRDTLPAENSIVRDIGDIGFSDPVSVGFNLGEASRIRATATSGSDPGVDFNELESTLGRSVSSALAQIAKTKKKAARDDDGVRARTSEDEAR